MKSYGRRTAIDQYDLNMNFIKTWSSIKEAASSFGFTAQSISNNLRGICSSAYGFKWKYCDNTPLEGEIWLNYPKDKRFKVSNKGRIQTPTGKITKGYNIGGYLRIRTSNISIAVHRMVAFTFLELQPGKDIVNHIDHDKQNNCVENLEWTTHRDNCLAAEKFYKNLPEKETSNER
jgi:hypothetical protein